MPSIADSVKNTLARRAATGEPLPMENPPLPSTHVAPTPPIDAPTGLGLPQRGMFSANLILASDRSDNSRVFRGAGMRSPVFQISPPSVVTINTTTAK